MGPPQWPVVASLGRAGARWGAWAKARVLLWDLSPRGRPLGGLREGVVAARGLPGGRALDWKLLTGGLPAVGLLRGTSVPSACTLAGVMHSVFAWAKCQAWFLFHAGNMSHESCRRRCPGLSEPEA